MNRTIVTTMLRYAMGAAGALLCLCVQANTLGIVTSGQGAAYDEFVETVRTELKSVPGLKIQLRAPGAERAAARPPDDTFMALAVGVQATRATPGAPTPLPLPPRCSVSGRRPRWPATPSIPATPFPLLKSATLARLSIGDALTRRKARCSSTAPARAARWT